MTPGELLAILLRHRSLTQSELASRIGRPVQMLSEIMNGKKRVTARTAIQLEGVFGLSARAWLGLQQELDLAAAHESGPA